MSAIGYACVSVAGFIITLGCMLEDREPGSFQVMMILAVFPLVIVVIDLLDHLMVRTVDRWIARHYSENKNS